MSWKMPLAWLSTVTLAVAFVGCDVDVKDPGKAPDVDVETTPGEMPDVDVTSPDVDVHTEEKEVTVPDVDVETEEKTIEVPDVDITPPDESENE